MKKNRIVLSFVFIFFIASGAILFQHFNNKDGQITTIDLPEGYEQAFDRVEKLKIDGSVSKYYDDNLDLVAFGPGSGWLKFKTRDGLTPILSFNRVSRDDVVKFNRFSKRIGLPIRVAFSKRVLRITSTEKVDDSVRMADITEEKLGKNSIMYTGLKEEVSTRMVLRKDKSGKIFLVNVDSEDRVPGSIPEGDILIAKKE